MRSCKLALKIIAFPCRSWGSDFVAGANGSMLQGQPVWRVTTDGEELSVEVVQELFSQSAADITAVATWDQSVRFYHNLLFFHLKLTWVLHK